MQSSRSGPSTVAFSAQFNVYPGPTDGKRIDILTTYKSNWPKWTKNQQTAYDTLTTIATNSNNVAGTGIINFGGKFFEEVQKRHGCGNRRLGNQHVGSVPGDPGFDAKLQTAINNYNDNAYPAINAAYTEPQWVAVATKFINNRALQQAYQLFMVSCSTLPRPGRTSSDSSRTCKAGRCIPDHCG